MNGTDMHGSTECHTEVQVTPQNKCTHTALTSYTTQCKSHTHTHSTDYTTQCKSHTTPHTCTHAHTHTHTHTHRTPHDGDHHQHKLQWVKTILGISRSRMQQPIAACTREQSLTRLCPCVTCNWFLHPAPTSA